MVSKESEVTEIEIVQGSVEYLFADVTADRTLDSQPVGIAIDTSTDGAVFADATWIGEAGLTRTCRLLLDGTLNVGKYGVWVKITDSPEIPIIKAGSLRVKAN